MCLLIISMIICCFIIQIRGCTHGSVRLVDGDTNNEGRVEICMNNDWGTVCDNNWGPLEAQVVCRQLGLPVETVVAYTGSYFGGGFGSILLDEVSCNGSENSLINCDYDESHNCDFFHEEDAGVQCLSNVNCVHGSIRIVNEDSGKGGRVEICMNNEWGTVCDNSWGPLDAQVVCRQLGLPVENAIAYSGSHFGEGTGSILLDNVSCNGSENSLINCDYEESHNCDHSEDAGVHCFFNWQCAVRGSIRLVNGNSNNEGRVEVCLNIHGYWRTVCDNNWGPLDAQVVCRQLGLTVENALAYVGSHSGEGTESAVIGDVSCTGSENSLFDCDFREVLNSICNYGVATVKCSSEIICTHGSVRLVNGNSNNEGRVEVCLYNNWGTVCDDGWGPLDAQVVCRQLGLPVENAVAYSGSHFGEGTGLILFDNVACTGSENYVIDCDYDERHFCYHSEDAGVKCQAIGAIPSFFSSKTTIIISSAVSQIVTPSANSMSTISLSDVSSGQLPGVVTPSANSMSTTTLSDVSSSISFSVPNETPDVVVINNALKVYFVSFIVETFTEHNELHFKETTANLCNTFCFFNIESCIGVHLSFSKRQWIPLSSDHIKILSKTDTSNGLEIVIYVTLSTVSVLPIDALNKAIQNGISSGKFSIAGFGSITAEPYIASNEGLSVVLISGIITGIIVVLMLVGISLIAGIILIIIYYGRRKLITLDNQNQIVDFEPVSRDVQLVEITTNEISYEDIDIYY